jgi:hypothetical protein
MPFDGKKEGVLGIDDGGDDSKRGVGRGKKLVVVGEGDAVPEEERSNAWFCCFSNVGVLAPSSNHLCGFHSFAS